MWFGFPYRQVTFLPYNVSMPAAGPIHPPIQWVTWDFSLGVKRPVNEADHSAPSSAKVKNEWN